MNNPSLFVVAAHAFLFSAIIAAHANAASDKCVGSLQSALHDVGGELVIKECRKLIESGRAGADVLAALGRAYHATGKTRDAVKYYRMAAEQGNSLAQNNLGVMYIQGRGVPRDDKRAVELFRQGAEQDYEVAQNNFGYMYQHGRGVAQNLERALLWYRRSADQGYARAQANLAAMYAKGSGVPRDDKRAALWYRRAADQGYPRAQAALGGMYFLGRGVSKDKEQAARWYQSAAEKGVAIAQACLGQMYYFGEGIEKDTKLAAKWYSKAAEQGNVDAGYILGLMYANGDGVPKNQKEALYWLNRSASHGHKDAGQNAAIIYLDMARELYRSPSSKPITAETYLKRAINLGGNEFYKQAMIVHENAFRNALKSASSDKAKKAALAKAEFHLNKLMRLARNAAESKDTSLISIGKKVISHRSDYMAALRSSQKTDVVKVLEFIWNVGTAINEACKSLHGGKCPSPNANSSQSSSYENPFTYNDAAGSMLFLQK